MFNSKSCQIVFKLGNKMKENPCLKRSDGLRRISTYFNAGTYHLCHFLLLQHYMFVNLFSLFFCWQPKITQLALGTWKVFCL